MLRKGPRPWPKPPSSLNPGTRHNIIHLAAKSPNHLTLLDKYSDPPSRRTAGIPKLLCESYERSVGAGCGNEAILVPSNVVSHALLAQGIYNGYAESTQNKNDNSNFVGHS